MAERLASLLRRVRAQLAQAGLDSPHLDARLIVEHFTRTSRSDAILRPEQSIADEAVTQIDAAIARRITGEPVHRILGFREFYGLKLKLSVETLEPRPDTEILVDTMLPFIRERVAQAGACSILDLGTGTGAIALALLSQAPGTKAVGVDISQDALATAAANAADLGLAERFSTVKSSWFEKIPGRFDVIVSNPPYIRSDVIPGLGVEVRNHDPIAALDGGRDGLAAYRLIAAGAASHLVTDGQIGVEIGYDQRDSVRMVFEAKGFELVTARQDFAGNDRVLLFKSTK